MSTHNICFHGEIRKILCGYPLLSVAMIPVCFFRELRAKTSITATSGHFEEDTTSSALGKTEVCHYFTFSTLSL